MGKIFRHILLALLAMIVFGGTVFYESTARVDAEISVDKSVHAFSDGAYLMRQGTQNEFKDKIKLEQSDEVISLDNDSTYIRFDDDIEIRLAPKTSLSLAYTGDDGYTFKLISGRIWINSLYGSLDFNVLAGSALVFPNNGIVDVAYDGAVANVMSYEGQANIGLVDSSYKNDKLAGSHDADLINRFLVADGGQATIPAEKVTKNAETIKRLLYSKLIKEFQYGIIDTQKSIADSWVKQNKKKDIDLLVAVEKVKADKINRRNLAYASLDSVGYQIDLSLNQAGDFLTFFESRQKDRLIQHTFDHILDAEYLLTFDRKAEADERIKLFDEFVRQETSARGEEFTKDVYADVKKEYTALKYVIPGHPLMEVKDKLNDLMMYLNNDDYAEDLKLIGDYLNYSFTLAGSGEDLLANMALDTYFSKLNEYVKANKAILIKNNYLLAEQNQIMDNLLRQYPQFYTDNVFAMKNFIETEWLKLIAEGTDKTEEKQTIIVTKIDFLKNLQRFFLDTKVNLDNAKLIALRLINEIKDLQTGNEVAVNELFALRLQDYGNFLRFLNTTTVTSLRGAAPQTKYEEFLNQQKEQISIEQAISEFGGIEQKPVVTAESIATQIKDDFSKVGITDIELGNIVGPDQKVVAITRGTYEKVSFTASYDWSKGFVTELGSNGKSLIQGATRLTSIPLILKPKEPTKPSVKPPVEQPPTTTTTPTTTTSKVEKVAKILLIQKLKANGIAAGEQNIEIVDLNNQVYKLKDVTVISAPNTLLFFNYDNKKDEVSELEIRTKEGITEYQDLLKLADVVKKLGNIQ